jgi:hypothetical protein
MDRGKKCATVFERPAGESFKYYICLLFWTYDSQLKGRSKKIYVANWVRNLCLWSQFFGGLTFDKYFDGNWIPMFIQIL